MTIPAPAPQSLPASLASVGTTAAKVSATATNYSDGATLIAARSNTGIIYVGGANTVTTSGATSGVPLAAGGCLPLDMADLSLVWAIADTAAQGLHVVGMKIEAFTGPAALGAGTALIGKVAVLGADGSTQSSATNPVPIIDGTLALAGKGQRTAGASQVVSSVSGAAYLTMVNTEVSGGLTMYLGTTPATSADYPLVPGAAVTWRLTAAQSIYVFGTGGVLGWAAFQ